MPTAAPGQPFALTVVCPGIPIEIVPAQEHWQVDGAVRTGTPPSTTLLDPGIHVPSGTGTHGIGVCTPRAAAVAAMTAGFAGELHIPKVGTFAMGIASAMVASGWPPAVTGVPLGIAVNGIGGPRPIVHDSMAAFTTTGGIVVLSPGQRDPGARHPRPLESEFRTGGPDRSGR